MNNDQFRKLVLANSTSSKSTSNGSSTAASGASGAPALGSRSKSSIPMTPRSLVGSHSNDFARQLAERNQTKQPQQEKKVLPSAPKGVRLGEGYVDRAKARTLEEEDERTTRLKELEGRLKKEEIDQETYDKLRMEIAGGDLSSTHLVKGLDFKLLEKIRRGEDIYGVPNPRKKTPDPEQDPELGVDDEFERLEEREITAIQKEKTVKKGQMAPEGLVPGKKRTRDQILADMKAARAAAKAKEEHSLGKRFRKIGDKKQAGTRIERDSKGREVLVIVDEDGHERRKVRKVAPGDEEAREKERQAMMPDKNAKPLGMEVPDAYKKLAEPEDEGDDIFADVGDDYDPLAGMDSGSDSSDSDAEKKPTPKNAGKKDDKLSMPPPSTPAVAHNYFKDSRTALVSETATLEAPSMSDPTILNALKKAASISLPKSETDPEAAAREEKRRRMLEANNRDDEDLDMGFGTSRFEDEEDMEIEEKGIKLSTWGEEGAESGHSRGGKQKRKRGPKKRKGDANSAADVMRVLEGRKAKES